MNLIFDIKYMFETYYRREISFLKPTPIRYGKIGALIYELSYNEGLYIISVLKNAHIRPRLATELNKVFYSKKDAELYLNSLTVVFGRNAAKVKGFTFKQIMLESIKQLLNYIRERIK